MKEKTRRCLSNLVLLALLGLTVAGIAVVATVRRSGAAATARKEKPVLVSTVRLALTNLDDTVTLPGRLEAWTETDLAVEQSGRIVALHAEKGAEVRVDRILLELDSRLATQSVRRAELALAEAESDFRRWSEMRRTGSVAESDFETARTRRDLAAVAVAEEEIRLSRTRVRSPVAGTVSERHVDEGEFVNPGAPVFRIVDVGRLKLVVHVPEADVASVEPGRPMTFRVDVLPEREFRGVVAFVAPAGDPASNTFRMEIGVDNSGGELRPGLIARVLFTRGRLTDVVVVPLTSLVSSRGRYLAFVVENGTAGRRVVRLSALVENRAVVLSGLAPGEELIVSGHRGLEDGVPVRAAVAAGAEM